MVEGIVIVDQLDLIEAIDSAGATLLYSTSAKLVGRGWAVVINPVNRLEREALAAGMRTSRSRGRRVKGTCTIRARGRAKRLLHWTIMPLRHRGSVPRTAILLAAEGQVEKKSRKKKDEIDYQDAFEHAIEGVFRTTLEGHYIQVNPALARLYGFRSPQELIIALSDIDTQLYVEPGRRQEFIERMKTEGFVSGFESEVRRADGSTIWIAEYARCIFDRAGNLAFYEGSVVDITGHQRAEAALRRSEEMFRLLVENMNLVPWESELDSGTYLYVGKQAIKLFGYPLSAWESENFLMQNVHRDDRNWLATSRSEALQKEGRFEGEYRVFRADDGMIWVREMVNAIESTNGKSIVVGFFLDVTHRYLTEESLKRSQHFVEEVASATQVIFFLYDLPQLRCAYINGQVDEILGYSKVALTEMQPLFPLALAHPAEIADHNQHFEDIIKTGTIKLRDRDFRLRRASGEWMWIRSTETIFRHTAGSDSLQVLATFQDITSRRQAIEELTNSETLFRSLAEATKVLPFQVHVGSGRFVYVGPQAESLFGHETRSWYGEGFWETIVHPDDLSRVTWREIWKVSQQLENKLDFQAEFRLRKPDGGYVWVREVVRVDSDGPMRGAVRGFLFDVSETRARQDEIERSRRQLKEFATRIEQVREEERIAIARELHDELGQALTLFRMDLDWLDTRLRARTQATEQEEVQKIAVLRREIDTTMEKLRRILSSLRPPILDELGLEAAIEWAARDFSRRVGIRCESKIEPAAVIDKHVATSIFRIFQEILTNIARHAKASLVKTEFVVSDTGYLLVVTDNGRGFVPTSPPEKKSFGLLGIRERAEALGGEVTITSSRGRGTKVTVQIPAHHRDRLSQ